MPSTTGRFHLYSDTSKFATGSVLYQVQNGKLKLIAYASKRLPEAAKSIQLKNKELDKLEARRGGTLIGKLLQLSNIYSIDVCYDIIII